MEPTNQRRRFLRAGGVSALAAGTVAAVGLRAPEDKADTLATVAQPANRPQGGYRLTEHVRRYYQTTLV